MNLRVKYRLIKYKFLVNKKLSKKLYKIQIVIQNMRKDLVLILLICTIFIILFDYWFINVSEIFTGANILGNIFYKLCFAYISAYVFYFLNIFIKSLRDKNEVNYYVASLVAKILMEINSINNYLIKVSTVKIKNDYPTEAELDLMTKEIKITDTTPLVSTLTNAYATWPQFLEYHKLKVEKNINKILIRGLYIDSKLIGILSKIEDSYLFIHIDFKAFWNKDSDLSFISSAFYQYFIILKDLENYYYKNLYPLEQVKTVPRTVPRKIKNSLMC